METGEKEKIQFKTVQIGVIVEDIDKAISYYESLGIGPFKTRVINIKDRVSYGKPASEVKNKAACAMLGPVEFELVQPISGDSPPMRFLREKGEGISHIGFHVKDLEKEKGKLTRRGVEVISSGKYKEVPEGGFVFFGTDKVGGVQFELVKQE